MQTRPLDGAFGVEVTDLDLAQSIDAPTADALRAALLDHRLLVFRDQKLSPEHLRDLGQLFGRLDVHPFIEAMEGVPEVIPIVKEADEKQNFGGAWHSEVSFYEAPAMGTLLYAVETPDEGGDTLLADAVLAYDALPDEVKAEIDGLQAEHSAEHVYGPGGAYEKRATGAASGTKTQNMEAATGRTAHPVVRTHPETGEKILYVNLAFTVGLVGRSDDEARPLLNKLIQHVVNDAFVTRLKWAPGTLALWDNRSTQHFALNDYRGDRREMWRVVVEGDRPI